MRIGVLGTGVVGRTIGSRLVGLGHDVVMGSRRAGNADGEAWAGGFPERARAATFADAAAHAELVVNATPGTVSLEALEAAGSDQLAGKVLVDVANPLDGSGGFPPRLAVVNDDSLGEQIQRAFPDARVVKALNTMTAAVMVEPSRLPGPHDVFIAGEDDGAKDQVRTLLESFGWSAESVHDVGGIASARGLEAYLPLWLRLMQSLGTPEFNIHVVR